MLLRLSVDIDPQCQNLICNIDNKLSRSFMSRNVVILPKDPDEAITFIEENGTLALEAYSSLGIAAYSSNQ